MNLFTRFLLFKLKYNLENRNYDRKIFGNLLKIKKDKIIKISHKRIKFEMQLIHCLINYYNKILHLDFQYNEDINDNLFYVISPFVNLSITAFFCSKKRLSYKTNQILTDFANTSKCVLNRLKKENPNIDHFEICCADLYPSNFFKYKKEFYLLDIEDFYFFIYDKENRLMHINDLTEGSKKHIIKYNNRIKLKLSRRDVKPSYIDEYKYIFV